MNITRSNVSMAEMHIRVDGEWLKVQSPVEITPSTPLNGRTAPAKGVVIAIESLSVDLPSAEQR